MLDIWKNAVSGKLRFFLPYIVKTAVLPILKTILPTFKIPGF